MNEIDALPAAYPVQLYIKDFIWLEWCIAIEHSYGNIWPFTYRSTEITKSIFNVTVIIFIQKHVIPSEYGCTFDFVNLLKYRWQV